MRKEVAQAFERGLGYECFRYRKDDEGAPGHWVGRKEGTCSGWLLAAWPGGGARRNDYEWRLILRGPGRFGRDFELSVLDSELPAFAEWLGRFARAWGRGDEPPSPPSPVTHQWAAFGVECRYLWSMAAWDAASPDRPDSILLRIG